MVAQRESGIWATTGRNKPLPLRQGILREKGIFSMMNNKMASFLGAIGACVVCLGISIYYIIPGYNHLLVTQDSSSSHPKHALAFFALAMICIVVALVTRPKAAKSAGQAEKEKDQV
jgi:hypothetical protein